MYKISDMAFIESISFSDDGKTLDRSNYPFDVKAVQFLDSITFHKNVTFLIGENGTGKSTLLEAVAVKMGLNPEGGSRNFSFSTKDTHSNLYNFINLKKTLRNPKDYYYLRAESFYNVATNIDQLDAEAEKHGGYGVPIRNFFGGRSLHEMSHGESFFKLVNERFVGNGIYLLDEPEAALSPQRQMAVISRIHDLCLLGAQFVIATHSPILLSYPNSKIVSIEDDGIFLRQYEETDIFKTTKNFLNNHQSFLKILME